jgi:amino acid transporter
VSSTESQQPRARKVLGMGDEISVSLSSMAPTFTISVSLGFLAGIVGLGMPIVWLIAILPMIAIAVGFARLNRRDAEVGTAYSWAGRYWHPLAGFGAGWLTVGGFVVFLSYAVPTVGMVTLETLNSFGLVSTAVVNNTVIGALIGAAWFIVLALLAIRGVDIAARMQKVIITVDLIAVVGLCGWALIHGGGEPIGWSWFNPMSSGSLAAFVNGLVATVYLYWGWDNSLRLVDESKDPKSIGRSAIRSLLIIAAVFVFCQVAVQHATTRQELIDNGANGLVFVAQRLAGQPGQVLAALALLLSVIAVIQATLLATSRQTLAMGRDRVLGSMWARLHPKYGTPAVGTFILCAIVLVLVCASVALGNLSQVINGAVQALGLLATAYYTICAIAVGVAFRGTYATADWRERVSTAILPAITALFLGALTIYSLVHNWVSVGQLAFDATNPRFQDLIALVVAALGIPVVIGAHLRGSSYFNRKPAESGAPQSADSQSLR